MSFFHNPSTFCNANGGAKACGAQKHCRGVQATIESIEKIEMDVLPFSDLGFAVEEVQVFWFPMDSRNIMNVIRGRPHDSLSSSAHSRPHGASHFRPDGASDTKVSNKQQARTDMKSVVRVERDLKRQQGANRMCLLEHARPPDSIFSLNQWRWCHMGLILLASNTNESAAPTNSHGSGVLQRAEVIGRRNTRNGPHLYIVLDLYETGVRIDRLLVGWSSDNKEEKLKKLVLDHCGQREVYSAGISEPAQDSDVWTIRKHVKIFREWGYNPAFFNCQHFTSILFHRLTGKNLPKCLRHRWTSNRSLRGDNPNVVSSINARGISAAMRDSRLLKENLCIVDMDQLLFSYSPCIFDENNRAMASVGLGVSATGGLLAAAAASATDEAPASHDQRLILGSSIVALGATAASLGLGYDKIPRLCPLSRATIWFRYDPEKEHWVWSPYRCGEVDVEMRWISVQTLQVPVGPYHGQSLASKSSDMTSSLEAYSASNTTTSTSADIVQYLARENPFPLAECHFECPVCFEVCCDDGTPSVVRGQHCNHEICAECHARLVAVNNNSQLNCPFCLQPF